MKTMTNQKFWASAELNLRVYLFLSLDEDHFKSPLPNLQKHVLHSNLVVDVADQRKQF